MPAKVQDLLANDQDYGQNSFVSFANFDQPTRSWKTSQLCLVEGLEKYSQTWPRSGMTQNGIAYQLQPLVPLTGVIAYGLLPTPRANDAEKRGNIDINNPRNGFPAAVKRALLPTPTASDFESRYTSYSQGGKPMSVAIKMALLPTLSASEPKGAKLLQYV